MGNSVMAEVGSYTIKPFSRQRQNISLVAHEGWLKHSIHAVLEFDVTDARRIIKEYEKKSGEKISFTGWLIKCVAQAISEHKELNSYRQGRKKIVIFDDVDVGIPVERFVDGEYRPLGYVIRKANEKNVKEITEEIRAIRKETVNKSKEVLGQELGRFERFVLSSPFFIRKFLLWIVRRNGILKKKYFGTIGLTSIGMIGRFNGWVIPLGGVSSTLVAVGGITEKPGVIDGRIKIREYLPVVVTVDHDLVDGGLVTRFIDRLTELVENAHELKDL
ncbi:MAG: 2-oxo acid dehydrogenase subunit E2 [Thermoplasmata archaeon]|nr:2-oxo acid dehydrogenase subunit E2 [Thermoplasmata archaeon]